MRFLDETTTLEEICHPFHAAPYQCLLLYKFGVWLNLFSFSCIAVTLETGVLMS